MCLKEEVVFTRSYIPLKESAICLGCHNILLARPIWNCLSFSTHAHAYTDTHTHTCTLRNWWERGVGQYNIMFCHCIQSSSKPFDLPPPPLSSIYRSKSFRPHKPRPYTTTKPLQRVHLDPHIRRRYSSIRPIFVGQSRNPIKAQQIDRKITDCFDAGYNLPACV